MFSFHNCLRDISVGWRAGVHVRSGHFFVASLPWQLCSCTGADTTAAIAEVATAVGYLIGGRRRYVPRPDRCQRCALSPSGAGAIGARPPRSSGRFHVRAGTTRGRGARSGASWGPGCRGQGAAVFAGHVEKPNQSELLLAGTTRGTLSAALSVRVVSQRLAIGALSGGQRFESPRLHKNGRSGPIQDRT